MIADIKKNAEQKMKKTIEALKTDLGKVRTGRAHTGILDHVMVEYYGNPTPLPQVANVTLVDGRTIGVSPYEKKMAQAIEKAIRDSDLGLNPMTQGDMVRVPMPALTEERRRDRREYASEGSSQEKRSGRGRRAAGSGGSAETDRPLDRGNRQGPGGQGSRPHGDLISVQFHAGNPFG
jgi:ribosome recycling factor